MARIHYQKGDIFDSTAQVLVNTVNCKGYMGKGLALAFKQRYPAMFSVYQQECKTGKLRIGHPTLYQQSTPWILNFPTKDHWRFPSKLEYLKKGLEYFVANYKKAGIHSIAFPKLGAQNGKLSWDDVGPLMAKYLSEVDIAVYIYITESDREYQYDIQSEKDLQKRLWEQFSELACSQERLQQEVLLSAREAKKVANKRETMAFASFADIETVDGLAKISLERIKDYLHNQRYIKVELSGMTSVSSTHGKKQKKPNRTAHSNHKKRQETSELVLESLFSEKELIGELP